MSLSMLKSIICTRRTDNIGPMIKAIVQSIEVVSLASNAHLYKTVADQCIGVQTGNLTKQPCCSTHS